MLDAWIEKHCQTGSAGIDSRTKSKPSRATDKARINQLEKELEDVKMERDTDTTAN